jgi:excinuclease ABC subunit C
MTKDIYKKLSEKIELPDTPGVYIFRDGEKINKVKIDKNELGNIHGDVIYIGKATSLKDRTNSYFSSDLKDTRGLKIVNMVLASENLTFIKTESVLEALLLENTLIKKYQPAFNTKEKDDKSYKCVVITKEDYPRVLIMRTRDYEKRFIKDASLEKIDKVYGPFISGTQITDAMKIIRKIFPYRDKCEVYEKKEDTLSLKNILEKEKPKLCFNAQIGLCPGICAGLIDKSDYKNNIKHIKDMFEGKRATIKKNLEEEMKLAAKEEKFERAAAIRNTIWALNHIHDVSLIKNNEDDNHNEDINNSIKNNLKINKDSTFRIEAFDVAHINGTSRVGVMTVVTDGKKEISGYKKFKLTENINDDYMGIHEMLNRRLRHVEWGMPDLIVIDGGVGQKNIAEKVVASMKLNIRVVSIVKDNKHKARAILGIENVIGNKMNQDINKNENKIENQKLKESIILANYEAHRFAIKYHKELRDSI